MIRFDDKNSPKRLRLTVWQKIQWKKSKNNNKEKRAIQLTIDAN